jgi:hypothetical protein
VIYPAKCDWWIACLVVSASLVPLGVGAVIAYLTVTQAMPPIPGLLGTVLPFGVGGLLLWMFWGTSYEISETELVNRLGPFCFRVPLNAIEEVVSTSGFCLVLGLGLSWSLDMLHVKYRKSGRRRAWTVSISPQDKTGFLQELAAAVPGLKIVGNGLGE